MFLSQVNATRYFHLLVSHGNLTLVFHARVVSNETDESVTLVHAVRINKEEAKKPFVYTNKRFVCINGTKTAFGVGVVFVLFCCCCFFLLKKYLLVNGSGVCYERLNG